jgi:RHS repeat-associated protein
VTVNGAVYTINGGQTWSLVTGSGNSYVPVDTMYTPFGTPADVKWLVADQLGTPRMVVDKTGSLSGVRRHDYLPFGEDAPGDSTWRTIQRGYIGDTARQKFTGYERDSETGLDYAQARYYSNTQGRFASVDPLIASAKTGDPQSWNRYSYARNNPLAFVDPDGQESIWIQQTNADGNLINIKKIDSAEGLTRRQRRARRREFLQPGCGSENLTKI